MSCLDLNNSMVPAVPIDWSWSALLSVLAVGRKTSGDVGAGLHATLLPVGLRRSATVDSDAKF